MGRADLMRRTTLPFLVSFGGLYRRHLALTDALALSLLGFFAGLHEAHHKFPGLQQCLFCSLCKPLTAHTSCILNAPTLHNPHSCQ